MRTRGEQPLTSAKPYSESHPNKIFSSVEGKHKGQQAPFHGITNLMKGLVPPTIFHLFHSHYLPCESGEGLQFGVDSSNMLLLLSAWWWRGKNGEVTLEKYSLSYGCSTQSDGKVLRDLVTLPQ